VEMYSAENESLNQQVGQLHEEIRSLRALLMSHKDCPVGHAQGIGQFLNGVQDPNQFNVHANPYGMANMQNGAMQGHAALVGTDDRAKPPTTTTTTRPSNELRLVNHHPRVDSAPRLFLGKHATPSTRHYRCITGAAAPLIFAICIIFHHAMIGCMT